jgi:phage minor structural protein
MCEVAFDNLNKVVTFRDKLGSDKGVYFMRGLNLRQASMTRDSYDFITRLIPYGADELTVASVNGGSMYIDNHQYSDKVIAMIWEDTNYDDASALLEDATKKLDDLSKPRRSYSADVIDLAKQSESYSAFEYKLGDTIHLIDNLTGVDDKQRIVKLTE